MERFGKHGWICLCVGKPAQVLELLGANQADLAVLGPFLASKLSDQLSVPLVIIRANQAWVIDQEAQRVADRALAEREERGRLRARRSPIPTPTPLPPVDRFPVRSAQALQAYLDEGSGAQRLPRGEAAPKPAPDRRAAPRGRKHLDRQRLHTPPEPLSGRGARGRRLSTPAPRRFPDEGSGAQQLPTPEDSGPRRLPPRDDSQR